jgi:hypothetical protein
MMVRQVSPRNFLWYRNPAFLLALLAALVACVVQSGELGTADTQHRLQSAHALWTSEPPVFPQEYPEFGIHGRGGKLQSWYGIGQSLLMLPADIAGTYIERLPVFARYNGNDPSVRDIVVSYSTNIFVTVMTALVCLRFLLSLGFAPDHAVAGVLAMLLATTHLHYTQNMMENNYIFLLTLTGFAYQYRWLCTGSRRALVLGSAAFGLNLLTRLTTGLDLLAGGLFVLLVLVCQGVRGNDLSTRIRIYLTTAIPIYIFFGLIDRLYQFYRFGSFFSTYLGIYAQEAKQRNPALPVRYPFEKPFHAGFFGALFAPEKSIFLFDPLLVLAILIVLVAWRRFTPAVKAYVLTSALLLLAYISFYARYTVWSGDFAWGDRYVSTAVELASLLAVPLLLRFRREIGRSVWLAGLALLAFSTVVQIASLAFWLPLEIYQMETLGHPTFVVGLRFENILAFAFGKMNAWGLTNAAMAQDPWDYVHITTWNFLPFLLKRSGFAPAWVVNVSLVIWYAGLAAVACTLFALLRSLGRSEKYAEPSPAVTLLQERGLR